MHLGALAESVPRESSRGRRRRITATCAVGVLLAAMAPGAAHAAPQPGVELPLTTASDVVATDSRVFISGGHWGSTIVVTDTAGTVTATLGQLAGPTDLALSADRSRLYVALVKGGAIAVFDTASLREVARYPVGGCPAAVALAGRYLFFGNGCSYNDSGYIGSVDLEHPSTVRTELGGHRYGFYGSPILAAGKEPGILVAGEIGLSSADVYVHRVEADGTLTLVQSAESGSTGGNLQEIDVSPDSSTVLTVSGSPYYVQQFWADDLTEPMHRYPIGSYPNAVEMSPDGKLVAGGTDSIYELDVHVFDLDGVVIARYELGERLLTGALGWSPDGSRLYAVSHDGSWNPPAKPHLHVLTPGA